MAPSRLMKLNWEGLLEVGCPADFVVVEANVWADIFSGNLQRKVLINGKWFRNDLIKHI